MQHETLGNNMSNAYLILKKKGKDKFGSVLSLKCYDSLGYYGDIVNQIRKSVNETIVILLNSIIYCCLLS